MADRGRDRESRASGLASADDYGALRSQQHREGSRLTVRYWGAPGLIRTSGDRAISTGTGDFTAGRDLDAVAEGDYWRENFNRRPYYQAQKEYSHYEPAYRFGWEGAGLSEYRNRGFEEIELDLRRGWEYSEAESARPSWEEARAPIRDAFDRARALEAKKRVGQQSEGWRPKSRTTRQGELL
jgi:hypothetical protein